MAFPPISYFKSNGDKSHEPQNFLPAPLDQSSLGKSSSNGQPPTLHPPSPSPINMRKIPFLPLNIPTPSYLIGLFPLRIFPFDEFLNAGIRDTEDVYIRLGGKECV
jgi:hypothetical protein